MLRLLQAGNLYVYCTNDPLKYVDRAGEDIDEACYDDNPKDDLMPKPEGLPGSYWQAPQPSSGIGYSSYSSFKHYMGPAGEDAQWHHIVEQSQILKSGFPPYMIHHEINLMRLDSFVHKEISRHYSSVRPYTNGLRVRDWLAGKSYAEQYEYGMNALYKIMFGGE